jgi:2-polyprenyl-6-methoxyphenol hydroxylase-like FAD-dependent oxidoreductase
MAERAAGCGFWLAFHFLLRGDGARSGGWIARIQRLLDDRQLDCAARGYLMVVDGPVVLDADDVDRAYGLFTRAAEIADRFVDPDLSALARLSTGEALIQRHEIAEGMRLLDEVMAGVTTDEVSPVMAGILYCATILCGRTATKRSRVVVGADGRHSLVARTVGPEQYHEKPPLLAGYFAYWSGLPMDGRFETYVRPNRGFAAWPTNDDLTLVIAAWPYPEFEANRRDIEGNYLKTLALAPTFAERVDPGQRESRFYGSAVHNYFRKPYGPGWVLVGDAGYDRDFIKAQGIQDAFRDAELCAAALNDAFSGARTFEAAMDDYQSARDGQALPMYEFTCQLATLEPPPPELEYLLGAMAGNQDAMDGFARLNAGVMSPVEFFSDENVGRILASARESAVN